MERAPRRGRGAGSGAAARPRAWMGRLTAAAAGALLALATVETYLWLTEDPDADYPQVVQAIIARSASEGQTAKRLVDRFWDQFDVDAELGYRPRLDGTEYGPEGVVIDPRRAQAAPGARRLLFVGDSVTHRAQLIEALRARRPGSQWAWLNAGVEGYGLPQIATYYARYASRSKPDEVILSLHDNDFDTPPVALRLRDGSVSAVMSPRADVRPIRPLMRVSRVYRRWVRARLRDRDPAAARAVAEEALIELAERVAADGARLSVVLLPVFAPLESWTSAQRARREAAIALLEGHGLRWFDLLEPLEQALSEGVDVQQSPGDYEHPSAAACVYFADHLLDADLLDERD